MDKGIVYILINPCLDGWVKIGMTNRNNINERLAELNRPENIPLSFRAYAVYEVDNPHEVEKHIHNLFDAIDESLHAREELANGKIRQREFFRISEEKAFKVLESVSLLRGDRDNLKRILPNEEEIAEDEIAEQTDRRPNFKFSMIKIPIGSELQFLYDDACICKTADMNNKVEYNGEEYSLTGLARKLLNERGRGGYNVPGPKYFTYQGETLAHLRNIKESREGEE